MPPILLMILVTGGFMFLAFVGYSAVDTLWLQKARVRQRVDSIAGAAENDRVKLPLQRGKVETQFPTIARIMSSRGVADKLLLMLTRAGIKLRPSEFVGLVAGIAIVLALGTAVLTQNAGAEILCLIIGVGGPFAYVKGLQARRLTMFNRQLPDTLSLIASAIRSGYGFSRAIQLVAEEMPAPMSEEFNRVLDEMNVGLGADTALMRMVERVGSYDFELVATAVIIQQEVGGNLAEVVENIGETIRDRVRVEGEMSALTAEGKISGIILVAMPFGMAIIISIANKGYLKPLITEPLGTMMIIGALCLQLLGALIIKRMLVLDY